MSFTENGALSHASTGSKVLDFFFKTVRVSKGQDAGVSSRFMEAYAEDKVLARRALLHLRDPRGLGKGERLEFYRALTALPVDEIKIVIGLLPEYGSYGDLAKYYRYIYQQFAKNEEKYLFKEEVLNCIVDAFASALSADNDKIALGITGGLSLASKWIPSNGSQVDRETDFFKRFSSRNGNMTRSAYRKYVGKIRRELVLVEALMSAGKWSEIKYPTVPSKAMTNYRKAFSKKDSERFIEYLRLVKEGKTKINSTGIMPHELVEKCMALTSPDPVIEAQWNDIVSKFSKNEINAISIVDVSGSMNGVPMHVAIALGILIASVSKTYRHKVITFHDEPQIISIANEQTLFAKVKKVGSMPWGMNTNFTKVFDLLIKCHTLTGELPERLFVFSDMQFDEAARVSGYNPWGNSQSLLTTFQHIENAFVSHAMTRPEIVFWNLRASTMDFPVCQDVKRVALLSGFSANMLKAFIETSIVSPHAMMMLVLGHERYTAIDEHFRGL